ncbi:MAG: hypothetical protein HQM09_09165 [Candidatus Riflebacteria bacterium]|nr:hypothetical protein [Candidatus Riflebacteria bacterium]
MAEERADAPLPEPPRELPRYRKKDKKRDTEDIPVAKMTPADVEAAHKKFLYIMFGLFFLVLAVMFLFNSQFDFMSGGGI